MISVCIATYNGEQYIEEQLKSILNQIGLEDEVVITDDNSTDSTIEIIKSFNDIRIKLSVNDIRLGATANFNASLSKAFGDIIFLSDQDDIWLKEKVSICIENLKYNDLVVSNCKVVDENLDVIHESYFKVVHSKKGIIKNLYKSTYLGCCLTFNRKVLDTILPVPNELMMYHDWWIGFIAEQKFDVYFESKPLILYRRHSTTTSSTVGKSKNNLIFKIKARIQLLVLGIKRLKELNK
jgi:glycosyltransferase involved in cell wall biosynthesis